MEPTPDSSRAKCYSPARQALREIRRQVRSHRDQIGDYRCWVDDEVLYHATLPELRGQRPVVPPEGEFHALCEAYYDRRQNPADRNITDIPFDSSVARLELAYPDALDDDLAQPSEDELAADLEDWQQAIRQHRAVPPKERTYHDDNRLYERLPERKLAVTTLPDRARFLGENCPAYNRYCQQHPDKFAAGVWDPADEA